MRTVHDIEVKLGLLQGLTLLLIGSEGLLDLRFVKVEQLYASSLFLLLALLDPAHYEGPHAEGRLALYRLALLLGLFLLAHFFLHLGHLLPNEAFVLFRVSLCHVVQKFPHRLHLLGCHPRGELTTTKHLSKTFAHSYIALPGSGGAEEVVYRSAVHN